MSDQGLARRRFTVQTEEELPGLWPPEQADADDFMVVIVIIIIVVVII